MFERLRHLFADALEVVALVPLQLGKQQHDGLDRKMLRERLSTSARRVLAIASLATSVALTRRSILWRSIVRSRGRFGVFRAAS